VYLYIIFITAALAAGIPLLDDFIALIGAVASSGLAVIFPPLFHTLTFWRDGLHPLAFVKNLAIIAVGFLGFIFGTYTSVLTIVTDFENRPLHNTTHANSSDLVGLHQYLSHPIH